MAQEEAAGMLPQLHRCQIHRTHSHMGTPAMTENRKADNLQLSSFLLLPLACHA